MIVALDFDGTVVDHAYPDIGEDLGAFPWIQRLVHDYGARILLWTLRDGSELVNAARYMAHNGVRVEASNALPGQHEWSMSPKVHRDLYIGDDALGIPLREGATGREVVDWERAGPMTVEWAARWIVFGGSAIVHPRRYTGS